MNRSGPQERCGQICDADDLKLQMEIMAKEIEMMKDGLKKRGDKKKGEIKRYEDEARENERLAKELQEKIRMTDLTIDRLAKEIQEKSAQLVALHTTSAVEIKHMHEEIGILKNTAEKERAARLQLTPYLHEFEEELECSLNKIENLELEQQNIKQEIDRIYECIGK